METNKPLVRAGYLLAAILVIIPLFDGTLQVWPLRFSDERWRFGSVGSLSNLFLVPLLGLLLAIAIATFRDSRRTKRILGSICGALAVVLAVLSVFFILDYFQVRTQVVPRMQQATAVATATAVAKNVLSIIMLALLSRAGFAGPKAAVVVRRSGTVTATSATPLIPLGGASRAE